MDTDMTHYPEHLHSTHQLASGTNIRIRPIRPEDAELLQDFVRHLSAQTKHAQFMENFRELANEVLTKMTHIDYAKDMVLIALHDQNGQEKVIAMARYAANSNATICDSIVVVADEWQNQGLATKLMHILIKAAQDNGLKEMTGMILASNVDMLSLAKQLGFVISNSDDPTVKNATKQLT